MTKAPLRIRLADALRRCDGLSFAEQVACVAALEVIQDHYFRGLEEEITQRYGTQTVAILKGALTKD